MNNCNHRRQPFAIGIFLLTLLTAFRAAAHPGHGLFDHGLLHTLTSPVHLLALALCGAGLVLFASLVPGRHWRLAARCAGAAAIALAGLLWMR